MQSNRSPAEPSLVDMVPFSAEVAPGIVKLRDNLGYCATVELEGVDFETCGDEQVDLYNSQLEKANRSLDPGCALWIHKVKSRALEKFQPALTDQVCAWVSDQYLQSLQAKGFVSTRLFVTLVCRPTAKKALKFSDFVKVEQESIQATEEMLSRFEAAAQKFRPTRLTHSIGEHGNTFSQALSFYGLLINGYYEEIAPSTKLLNHLLCASRLTFAERSGVIKVERPDGSSRFAMCIEPRIYPSSITPNALSPLLYSQQDFIETQSFSVLSMPDAIDKLRRQRTQMISGGQASAQEVAEIGEVIEELRRQAVVVGEYHYSLTLLSDTLADLKTDRQEIKAALAKGDLQVVEQTTIPEAAWFYHCPGNWRMRTRVALMTSRSFAALSPLHCFMRGKKKGNPWGDALALFDSPSGQPFYFNFHPSAEDKDNKDEKIPGNTCIYGSTGVGKTTLETFLICMLNAYGARVMVLDMDRSTEIALRAFGGVYKSFRRGMPTGINPFQWADTPANRSFCKKLVTLCVTRSGQLALSAEEENRISTAVDTVYLIQPSLRRLSIVAQNLPATGGNSLSERLRRWVGQGDLAWVLDNEADTLQLTEASLFGFDYSEFIDDAEISGIFVSCLLAAAEELKDGRPFALFMEEFWKPLSSPALLEFSRDQLKTIRKENGIVVLTTQQPDDVTSTPLAKTAIQQTQTGIFLPNPKALWDDYRLFGLTAQEFEIVRALPEQSRCFLVKQSGKSAICLFDLAGSPDVIRVLSGNKESVQRLDRIRAQVGDAPEAWMPAFLKEVA